jgi:hypothetical protein
MGRTSYQMSRTVLAVCICIMAGIKAYPQIDRASQLHENAKNAAMTMRALASAEAQYYRESSEVREFGTAAELFNKDLIDADVANALGCLRMTSVQGATCPGTHAPFRGYLFRLEVVRSSPDGPGGFRIVGVPAVAKGETQTGAFSFYVDHTYVIRASDDPTLAAGPLSPALGAPNAPVI